MSFQTIEQDVLSGLSLLKDGNDPPRFYVQRRHRRELIAIGDEVLARSRFAAWKSRMADAPVPGLAREAAGGSFDADNRAGRTLQAEAAGLSF